MKPEQCETWKTCDEHGCTGHCIALDQQLVARLKRSSKYYGQTKPGAWFDVRVVNDRSYHLRGNNNNYRLSDAVLGMRLGGGVVIDLVSGKPSEG